MGVPTTASVFPMGQSIPVPVSVSPSRNAVNTAPVTRNTTYPRSSSPVNPTTTFSPSARIR